MNAPYFSRFENRRPPRFPPMGKRRENTWHVLAGVSVGLSVVYLHWRWSASLNPDTMVFSVAVAMAETLFVAGSLLFYFDIWREGDTEIAPPPATRAEAGLSGRGAVSVDVYITTFDETGQVLAPSLDAALALAVPPGVDVQIFVLDDGNRPEIAELAHAKGTEYLARTSNEGFKAGNLRNALFQTSGDFVVICDADTRLEPHFLENTLGYFRNPKVAWVQTPHWFYDIPEGRTWAEWLVGGAFRRFAGLAPALAWVSGSDRVGRDPFLADPALFFDVIQRRRNRHGASFCCGAGSIHRRDAIFAGALRRKGADVGSICKRLDRPQDAMMLNAVALQPFRYHVSEDIYTSILLQEDRDAGWISVFHPQVEARMLSPWSMNAWASQKLKYAGGTFDIMMRDNPLFRRGMPLKSKLHYAATFWSYLTILWAPVLLLAPAVSLVTAVAPVKAYSAEFFQHFLPMIIASELAIVCACKGHAVQPGRLLALSALPVHLRAFWTVLRGRRPRFPPTPKLPILGARRRHVAANLWLLAVMAAAAVYGGAAAWAGLPGYDRPLLVVNLFWLGWNMLAVGRIVLAARWRPELEIPDLALEDSACVKDANAIAQS